MGILDATTNVAQGLAQFAVRASEVLPNAAPNAPLEIDPGARARAISEKLENFCVPKMLNDLLTPALAELDFEIKIVQLKGLPGTPPGSHNVIQNRAGHRSLLHFPKEVLEDELVWQSVGNVFQRLGLRDQEMLILSEGLPATHPFFVGVGQQLWLTTFRVTATFLPWSYLVPPKPLAASDLLTVLPALLKLEDLITQARNLPPINKPTLEITMAEVTKIANILGQLPVFVDNGEEGWRIFMNQAGLDALVGALDLSGSTTTIRAINVIVQLKDRKPLPDRPEQVLGRFLRQVLEISGLKPDDGTQISDIITTYNL